MRYLMTHVLPSRTSTIAGRKAAPNRVRSDAPERRRLADPETVLVLPGWCETIASTILYYVDQNSQEMTTPTKFVHEMIVSPAPAEIISSGLGV
jgi:hypothetical protein